MLGCYDFCGHYDWTFEWLRRQGGESLVRRYWDEAIHRDSQQHAARLIAAAGIEGMAAYWGHTLADEGAGYRCTAADAVFRIDMHACPSKGFLRRNDLAHYHDYCDHCMGWTGPLLKQAGFVADHEHNHLGQCWWEIRAVSDATPASSPGALVGDNDVRLGAAWKCFQRLDVYVRANDPDDKITVGADGTALPPATEAPNPAG